MHLFYYIISISIISAALLAASLFHWPLFCTATRMILLQGATLRQGLIIFSHECLKFAVSLTSYPRIVSIVHAWQEIMAHSCIRLSLSAILYLMSKFSYLLIQSLQYLQSLVMGLGEKIKQIEQEIARTQKNKATQYHIGQLKAKLAKYRTQLLEPTGKGVKGEGFQVSRFGNARVCMIGFPSVGKSTLLTSITDTQSLSAAYQFTTLTCIPGVINYNDAKIQLLDLPGIIQGAADGKGRGRQVIAVAKNSDMVLMVLDATKAQQHRVKISRQLQKVGIRLNRRPPQISITPTKFGGVKLNSTKALTHLNQRVVKNILSEYKLHNADVLIHDDSTVDDLIDIIQGNRKYVRCLYCYNKIDMISLQEVNMLAEQPNSVVISCNMKLNFDGLLQKIWEMLDLVRVYTKKPHQAPDFGDPIVLTNDRNGCLVKSVCQQIHRDLPKQFNFAKVWGKSCKFIPQKVGLSHVLEDQDVLQIYKKKAKSQLKKQKTGNQQKKPVDLKKKKK